MRNRIATEFTIPNVLADFLATQLGAKTGETTLSDWGVCGYKIGDAQPLEAVVDGGTSSATKMK